METARRIPDADVEEIGKLALAAGHDDLFQICNEVVQVRRRAQSGDGVLHVSTMVNPEGLALVSLRIGDVEAQLSPAQAREHAGVVFEAAADAESEAALFAFILGQTDDRSKGAAVLGAFRAWKARQR